MDPVALVLALAGGLFVLSLLAAATARRPGASEVYYGAVAVILALVAACALPPLVSGQTSTTILPLGLPWIGAHFALGPLAALFVLVIGIGGTATAVYAIGYGRHEREPQRVVPFLPAFLGAMLLVVMAADAFTFLLSWEVMSLLSWALVLSDHRNEDARSAAFIYLVMAGFGTVCLLLAFGLLSGGVGAYEFAAIRTAERSPAMVSAILALTVLGAGSKAGLVPLHVWLPRAHPAAPSHVSALMSGVMTKVAVYGFIRVTFDLVGPLEWWMGAPVILIGSLTAVFGILNAVLDSDIKRALAYSTIENIGVIFAALGLAIAFRASGMPAAAALAMTAALFHVFNHTAFKSLLFMGAGAVLTATGERNLDSMGGLIQRMPVTSFLVLVGVTAISALPPLNGFASEWLLFQSILKSPDLPQAAMQIVVPAAGGLLALAAALAAAAMVRIYGVGFLGRPRSDAARNAREVDPTMWLSMAALAALCVVAGVLPGAFLDLLAQPVSSVAGSTLPNQLQQPWLTLVPIAESRSTYNGLLVFAFILISGSLTTLAIHRFASREVRRGPAWDCGFPNDIANTQYGAGSFAQPIRRVLGSIVLGAREEVSMPAPGDMRAARHTATHSDPVWQAVYAPMSRAVDAVATRANRLQFLTIRRYLGLVMGSLVLLLLVLTIWH